MAPPVGAARGRTRAHARPWHVRRPSALHCRKPDLGLIRPWRIVLRFGPRVDQMASQRLLSSLCRDFRRSAQLTWDRLAALFATVSVVRVCGMTQFAGLRVGVNDANTQARLVLDSATSSLRFERACERAAAHSEAHSEARSMPSSQVPVYCAQVCRAGLATQRAGGRSIG